MEQICQICHKKNKTFWLFLLTGSLLSVLLFRTVPAYCQEQLRIPLTKFNAPGIVKLTESKDDYSLKIATPKRWQIEDAILELAYVNSTALIANRSRLVILFNDYPLAQVTLEPGAPEGHVKVAIPARLFKVGYNDLKIQVVQASKEDGCIPANPSEVWTTLTFIDSTLALSYTRKEVPLSLASVADFLFDPKINGENHVHIVTESTGNSDVSLAALAAAAVALRFDYRPVQFSTGQTLVRGKDNIVIGTHSFLRKVAGDDAIQDDMGILPMPGEEGVPDRLHGLIYLGGDEAGEIRRSVEAFSVLSLPLPDVQSCKITEVQLPLISSSSGRNRLAPEKRYTFQELGLATTTFRGQRTELQSVQFTLPASFLLEGNRDILLRLDFSYGAAMREDSVLSLAVNGKFVASIPLNLPKGGQYKGYTVRLPLSYFNPGRNVLQLSPIMTPLHSKSCEMMQTDHLALTLFESSTIQVPELFPWVKLPQLSYLFNDGYPLTEEPDFSKTSLVLTQRDAKILAAAFNLIAGTTQRTGVLPYGLTVTETAADSGDKNLLVVGSRAELAENILHASPLAKKIAMPVHGRLPGTLRIEDWKDRLWEMLFDEITETAPVTPDRATLGTDIRLRPQQAVLCEFESPLSPMKTVVLLTAEKVDDVLQASLLLQENEVTQQCGNGLVIIDFDGEKPVVQQAAMSPSYTVGELAAFNRISYLVNKYRWSFIALLAGLLVLLSLGITILVKRRRSSRLQAARMDKK